MDATPQDAAYISPDEAAHTLREIRTTQARVVRARPWFPAWYTTGVALYVTGVQFATEPGTPMTVTVTWIIALTAALVGLVLALVFLERQRPYRSLVTPGVLGVFLAWVASAVAVGAAFAFPLDGAGVPYARTWATLVMTAYMTVSGPTVARWITRRMASEIEAG
ncbi:hypothetical protein Sme01_12640 [Sphaerisporangium melleum]|uniref:Uncharacterized protein n=1 Tax=Sphaerisporangium melleum TaxID=321316 RepID=A0A917RIL6_9ACTN|nr:hypothetical protein [Sphaerisporangium melleum]GGL08780.1 hypothetical protein GCM10007964_58790 [Sphaerisporangium melleum]GII68788.1 hypothetical protein Sme01_12640 [Sphaerisporangium melleum]